LKSLGYGVSELEHRDYGQTEFFLTDDMTAIHIASVSRPKDRHSSRRIGTENQDTLNCAVEPCETVQEFEAPIARTK